LSRPAVFLAGSWADTWTLKPETFFFMMLAKFCAFS